MKINSKDNFNQMGKKEKKKVIQLLIVRQRRKKNFNHNYLMTMHHHGFVMTQQYVGHMTEDRHGWIAQLLEYPPGTR